MKTRMKEKGKNMPEELFLYFTIYLPLALLPDNGVTPLVMGARKFLSTTFSRKAQKLPPRQMWPGQSRRDGGSTGPELALCHAM